MNQVVPWSALVTLIEPHARSAYQAPGGRPPFPVETMLRIHCLQLWWNLSDPAMQEELHERLLYLRFVSLDGAARLPDETTILRFGKIPSQWHLLEKHELAAKVLAAINATLARQGLMLKTGTEVDTTIITTPSSTKNKDGERDPEIHQTKKCNQWHFGMKAHIGVDAASGLAHTVIGTAANVNDVTQASKLLHGEKSDAWGDARYQGVDKREEFKDNKVCWEIAMRAGKRRALNSERELHQLLERAKKLKASIRAKVEHPFSLIKQQFGYAKVRYRGLAKNTARLTMLFALGHLWMVRRQLMGA